MKNGDYILIVPPEEYPGKRYRGRYAYEHQVVWWLNTGMTVPEGYCVHHKNEQKHDNSFANLEIISSSQHARSHVKPKELTALVCDYCNAPFIRDARNVKFKKGIGQNRFYCSRSHMGKAQDVRNKSRVAQGYEQVAVNHCVGSSNLSSGATNTVKV